MLSRSRYIKPVTPLVIRFGRLGDMLLQEPLLHLLHRRYGRPCRMLTRGSWSDALYSGHPDVAEVWQLLARHKPVWISPERWWVLVALHRHAGPIYVSEDTRSALKRIRELLRLARVPHQRCVFVNDSYVSPNEHWIDQMRRFGRTTPAAFNADDYPCDDADSHTAPRLYLDAADHADAAAWIEQRGFANTPIVLLQPGNWKTKRWGRKHSVDPKFWPIQCWVDLLRAMHADMPTAHLVLCGSPVETGVLNAIRQATNVGNVEIATHDLPIRRLLAVLERAHSMVSVDTGPAHLAAAMGCPLITLYGSHSPLRWSRRSPFGKPVIDLGGAPQTRMVADISLTDVIATWRRLRA
jgi:heptosyltransferase-2/heptosyltransferase-3